MKLKLGHQRLLLITILLTIVILLIPNHVIAQNAPVQNTNQPIRSIFSISPIIIDTSLKKGQNQEFPIRISNKLDAPLGIKVTVENFFPNDGETEVSGQFKNSPLVDWIKISDDNFILGSKKENSITLSINPPKDLKNGGYYALVFFTPFYSNPIDNSSPTILSKVGTLVLATAGDINYQNLKDKISVQNLKFNLFNEKNPMNYSFQVQNSYFTHFSAKPFLTISPLFAKKQRIQLEDKRVLPGTSRLWTEKLDTKRLSFFNKASLAVSMGQGNYVYKDSFFFVLPIREITILILIILALLVIKFRGKQIKKAVKIIYKGK
jgi:hypothetical protein